MIKRYYIDTSVFGGYFDREFNLTTKQLFDQMEFQGVKIIYSELTQIELINAPIIVQGFVNSLDKNRVDFINLSDEALNLADFYIAENVVGRTSRADCIHIALATINRADVLVSWNFKHIVNLNRIKGYNSVNMKMGYPLIEIRSPLELIDYENQN